MTYGNITFTLCYWLSMVSKGCMIIEQTLQNHIRNITFVWCINWL